MPYALHHRHHRHHDSINPYTIIVIYSLVEHIQNADVEIITEQNKSLIS